MDDFGNIYQDEAWFYECDAYGHSTATFGFLDDTAVDLCIAHCINHAAQDI